jgi:hypothetical protein
MPIVKQWNPPDSLENYKENNSGKPNYTMDEVEYVYNEDGYRCDEFTLDSEFPILFMGCSFTEGVGLPPNEIWSHHLHTTISNTTSKKIPYWSLGKGGTGIDYAARCFYEYSTRLKPKYIFYLMSGVFRREFCFESPRFENWFPMHSKLYKPSTNFQVMTRIFSDTDYAMQQTERSAMILNSVATNLGANIFIFDLDTEDPVIDKNKKTDTFSKFDKINYIPLPNTGWMKPDNVPKIEIPEHIKNRPHRARDSHHPGAVWQYRIYDFIWSQVKDKISLE